MERFALRERRAGYISIWDRNYTGVLGKEEKWK